MAIGGLDAALEVRFAICGLEEALEVRVLDRCGYRWAASLLAGQAWQLAVGRKLVSWTGVAIGELEAALEVCLLSANWKRH